MSFLPAAVALSGAKISIFDKHLWETVPATIPPIQSIIVAYILVCIPQVLRVMCTAVQLPSWPRLHG